MIELKAGVMRTPHNEGMSFDKGSSRIAVTEDETEFYLKSEADKVIRQQKYKRCLKIAEICEDKGWYYFATHRKESAYLMWGWRERWLDIARQFKED